MQQLEAGSSETKFQFFVRTKGVYVAMTATMLGLFAGIPLLFWFSSVMMIGIGSIFILIFICGAIGFLQWKFVHKHIDMEYRHFAMFSFSGFGMILLNIILCINYNIRISQHSETYTLGWIRNYGSETEVTINNVDEPVQEHVNNYLNSHSFNFSSNAKKVNVTYDKGLFGFEMVSGCKIY